MDVAGTTITIVVEVYHISCFIHEKWQQTKDAEADRLRIQDRLAGEVLFVKAFNDEFFATDDALQHYERQKDYIKADILRIYTDLRSLVEQYLSLIHI